MTMPPEVIDAALAALRNEDRSAEIAAKKCPLLDGVVVDTTQKKIAAYIPHEDFAAIFRAVNLIPL